MSERDSRSVDAIDELAARVLLGVPESGDGEKLGRLLAECPEARERFLDHATIQSFLAEEGKAGTFAPDPAGLFKVLEGGRKRRHARHPWRWASAAAAAVTIGLLGLFLLNLPGRADAAMKSLEQVIAAFSRLEDRSYLIHVDGERGSQRNPKPRERDRGTGRFHPAAHLDGARLFLRGGDQFVLKQSLPNGEERLMGGNSKMSWSMRGEGPVRISDDPQRFRGGVPGGRQHLTFLDLRSQLDELKKLYQLEMIEPVPGEVHTLHGLRGSRHSEEQGGPKRVEIWFDPDSGTIQRMLLDGLPRNNGGPARIELELLSTDPLAPDFFTHEAHHAPGRPIEPERIR
ncbi:MAG: hypothetical protein CMN05_15090 [Roseibacillus sp.]|nr:hypothetical protein [Roseibacillus sp.]MCP4894986.1 hypothetical protein [Actinomycetales bacterium]